MRIEFVPASRQPVTWSGEVLHIGREVEAGQLRLDAQGVAARHARITSDRRGLVLDVERGAPRVYVNARPVRERALLRLGDILGIGECRLRLCADAVPEGGHDPADFTHGGLSTVALRVVAGPMSGRVLPVHGHFNLDAHGDETALPAATALRLLCRDDGVDLESTVDTWVNGVSTRAARLGDGDQIVVGLQRFVLDVAVLPVAAHGGSAPDPQPDVESATPANPHGPMGWLIATAALLALLLAWVLVAHY